MGSVGFSSLLSNKAPKARACMWYKLDLDKFSRKKHECISSVNISTTWAEEGMSRKWIRPSWSFLGIKWDSTSICFVRQKNSRNPTVQIITQILWLL